MFQRLAKAKTLEQQEQRLREANLKHMLRCFTWGGTLNPIDMVREERTTDACSGRTTDFKRFQVTTDTDIQLPRTDAR